MFSPWLRQGFLFPYVVHVTIYPRVFTITATPIFNVYAVMFSSWLRQGFLFLVVNLTKKGLAEPALNFLLCLAPGSAGGSFPVMFSPGLWPGFLFSELGLRQTLPTVFLSEMHHHLGKSQH